MNRVYDCVATRGLQAVTLAALMIAGAATAPAQLAADQLPEQLKGIGIEEQLDARIPLELEFYDEHANKVRLGDYFGRKRPVILTLNYYSCPLICDIQLNGMMDTLKELDWTPGEQFEIVTVSFDPLEEPALARAKKNSYINAFGRPQAARGWHFLTGRRDEIKALTQAVGFSYRWNEDRNEWAHATALILITPDGHVSRYLGGIAYEPEVLRLSLIEASQGKIGSLWDSIFLWCHNYDPDKGYTLIVMNVMRAGAGLTLLVLSVVLLTFWRREILRRRAALAGT